MGGEVQETALAKRGPGAVFSFAPQNMDEAARFCAMLAKSTLVPREFKDKPENVMLAIQMGAELGFQPMQSIQSIAVINGRPSVWGDGLLGLVEASGLLEDIEETFDEDAKRARCRVVRKGRKSPVERSFSWADAENVVTYSWESGVRKAAKLVDKDTYKSYPRRMLQMRARTFALRDAFADVLRGLTSREEAEDLPTIEVDAAGGVSVADTAAYMPKRAGESATPAASSAAPAPAAPAVVEAEVLDSGAEMRAILEAESVASTSERAARSVQAAPSDGAIGAWGPFLVPKYSESGSDSWVGVIGGVADPAEGGKRYMLTGHDGKKFGTFSKSIADAARAFIGSAEPLRVTFEDGEFGRDVKTIQARAGVVAPGSSAPAAPADAPKRRGRPAASAPAPAAPPAPVAPPTPAPAPVQNAPAEAFDDEPPAPPVLISTEQKAELVKYFNEKGKTPAVVKAELVKTYGVERLADLPAIEFESLKRWALA